MEKLSDFKPLKRVVLPGLGELQCAGLTVIVGPNSSGKTQLLRDIKGKVAGEARDLVVATEIEVETPELEPFIKCLKSEGYIYSFFDDNDQEQYVPMTPFLGMGQPAQNIQSTQAAQWHSRSTQPSKRKRKNEFFNWCTPFLVSALFLENRLTALKSVSNIDFQTQPPQQDLHALHLNDPARKALTEEAKRAFSKAIWSDISRGSILCLRIGQDDRLPSAEDRHSVEKMSKYRTIEDEGDGMKSYVATCVSILLGRRPVCVIDEPEMCLHPPQAYNLGQFVGEHGTSSQTATFVATHSSQVLRGVIQTADKLQIVRLSIIKNRFHAKQVDSDVLAEAMKKPTVRAETVLDGIFSQAVAIVEADGDRIVYQATWEKVGSDLNFDIHFATAGGTGGIADTCELYRVLGIPVAVIADLDVVTDTEKIKRVLDSLCEDATVVTGLMQRIHEIAKAIRLLPPTLSEDQTVDKLKRLAGQKYDWEKGNDKVLRSELNSLSNSLNGMRGVKDGGLRVLPDQIRGPLERLLRDLEGHGVFLVPYGELEDWLMGCGISASKKKNKWAWANEAAQYIRENESRQDDIWEFVRRLGRYLTVQVQ
jgi:predicted ATPase